MKIIIDTDLGTDNITSVTASSEDAEFPAESLLNDWPSDCWKAASGTSATLTFEVSKGSAIELYNTNATEATVWAGSGESYTNETGYTLESGYSFTDDEVYTETTSDLPGVGGRLWSEYPEMMTPHIVKIMLTADTVPYAGIARAGMVEEFGNPKNSMKEGSKDYSIERELNNGADYFRKRSIVRTFGNLHFTETQEDAWKLKHDIFDAVGPKPLAIQLISDEPVPHDEFVLFAKRTTPPEISPGSTYYEVELSLKEVV